MYTKQQELLPTQTYSNAHTPTVEEETQLSLAMAPRHMTEVLNRRWGAVSTEVKRPVCRLVDMKYKPGEHCLLVYEWAQQWLIGELRWGSDTAAAPNVMGHAVHLPAPLNMWIYDFAHDPQLPGLATILDSNLLTETLQQTLPADFAPGECLVRCRAVPYRYRPGKRCTVRLELTLRHRITGAYRKEHRFAKLYHDQSKAQSVYNNMQSLTAAQAFTERLPPSDAWPQRFILARACAYLPELAMVIQEPVSGQPLDMLLSHPKRWTDRQMVLATEAVCRAAQALAQLHQLPASTKQSRLPDADLRKLQKRAHKVTLVAPKLGHAMTDLAAALHDRRARDGIHGAALRLSHGDCKPNQFLLNGPHVALLDFDHCAMSDPAADVALFIATLRQAHKRLETKTSLRRGATYPSAHGAQWSTHLATRFLAEYMAGSQVSPDFRQRVAWYTALALLRKAWRGFARSPRSPLPAHLISEAWRCL